VLKLWEVAAEDILRTELFGLLPLLPLTREGQRREVVEKMIDGLVTSKELDLLPLGEMLAGLRFRDPVDREWLKRRFAVHSHFIEESWVYQEILQKGMEKGIEKGMEKGIEKGIAQGMEKGIEQGMMKGIAQGMEKGIEQVIEGDRAVLLAIVRTRFAGLKELAQQRVAHMKDLNLLQNLIIKMSLAGDEYAARKALLEVDEGAGE